MMSLNLYYAVLGVLALAVLASVAFRRRKHQPWTAVAVDSVYAGLIACVVMVVASFAKI
jgi:LPXTG-motif cell wall-anchored protein